MSGRSRSQEPAASMSRFPYGTQLVIDNLSRKLDEIEKTWPMTGSYERIEPYIIPLMQADQWFEMIIYHLESKLWFDQSWTDLGVREMKHRGYIAPGSVAFDIGCNSGSITIPMAMLAGPSGHVHAFDPYPWNAAATQASSELNRLFNVTVHALGLSNKTHTIAVSPNDSRIYEASADTTAQKLDIRHISEYMHLKPSFLKIDIEGSEHELFDVEPGVYASVESAMLEFHPTMIAPRGLDCRDTLRNIRKQGFQIFFFSPDAAPYDVEHYSEHHHSPFWLLRQHG